MEEQRGLLCGNGLVVRRWWPLTITDVTSTAAKLIQVKDVKMYFFKRKVTHMETIGEKSVEVILWQ